MGFHELLTKNLRLLLYASLTLASIVLVGWGYVVWYLMPQLPSIERLKTTQLKTPMRIYSKDKLLIAEYGQERRIPVNADDMPDLLIKAVLAAEDDRFYQHFGVDVKSLVRAVVHLVKTGRKSQGASTITMQVARNFYLTPERSFKRKAIEILLALQIEQNLNKQEILELYLNKIFLGHRAYGIGAAAQVYYGKTVNELTLAQCAMLAGLPKAPSSNNPLSNPKRALERRNYILERMLELHYIEKPAYEQAVKEVSTAEKRNFFQSELQADYIAEMVRQFMVERYGRDNAYSQGYKVYTTINSDLQQTAQTALRQTLLDYDARHGYRGAVANESDKLPDLPKDLSPLDSTVLTALDEILAEHLPYGHLQPALVLAISDNKITAHHPKTGMIDILWPQMRWARPYISDTAMGRNPVRAQQIVKIGDVILVEKKWQKTKATEAEAADKGYKILWRLAQAPQIEGALVALNPKTGEIISLIGGFDFRRSKFNRVTQAERQVGSNFKPFVYSAALAHGFTPATLINDAPLVLPSGSSVWRPSNYSGKFSGPMRLREALKLSRNTVSVRIMDRLGVRKTVDYVTRFGFKREALPRNLTLSLGSVSLPPMQVVEGFSVFASGGYRLPAYFIQRVEDAQGQVIYQAEPLKICPPQTVPETADDGKKDESTPQTEPLDLPPAPAGCAPQVISQQNAWLMTSMLKDVIQSGTATRARKLNRTDLAGKTGTTNEERDAWFSGYNQYLVATAWVGFDQPRSLGDKETGGRTALPMWMDFMEKALADKPDEDIAMPDNVVTVRIDKKTGLLASASSRTVLDEHFEKGQEPTRYSPFYESYDYSSVSTTTEAGNGAPPQATPVKTLEQNLF